MANEIVVYNTSERQIDLIFLFPIASPVLDKDGSNVVPTPFTSLSTEEQGWIQAADTADGTTNAASLAAGTMIAVRTQYITPVGETGPQALAKVREMYAAQQAAVIAEYHKQYEFASRVGQIFDA